MLWCRGVDAHRAPDAERCLAASGLQFFDLDSTHWIGELVWYSSEELLLVKVLGVDMLGSLVLIELLELLVLNCR